MYSCVLSCNCGAGRSLPALYDHTATLEASIYVTRDMGVVGTPAIEGVYYLRYAPPYRAGADHRSVWRLF